MEVAFLVMPFCLEWLDKGSFHVSMI